MTRMCQIDGCTESGELLVYYSSEHISDDQEVSAAACSKHKGKQWRYFEDHTHYYPIRTEEL